MHPNVVLLQLHLHPKMHFTTDLARAVGLYIDYKLLLLFLEGSIGFLPYHNIMTVRLSTSDYIIIFLL